MYHLSKNTCNVEQFIEFWSTQYDYPNERLYKDNIDNELTEKSVFELFEWKNGLTLSGSKRQSIYDNYITENDLISKDASTEAIKEYLNRPGGAVWRIFWLHCNYTAKFPIFDQHVYRAMAYLKEKEDLEIVSNLSLIHI